MRKHWLFTTLLAIALCVICFTLFLTEAKAASVDDLTFTLNSDGQSYTVSDCSESASGALEIPVTYNGKPVITIGNDAFCNCDSLESITIPNSVTSIGDSAFYDCYGLTSVTIPDSVTSIGDCAFEDCSSLTSITIPDGVTSVGNYAFDDCYGLTGVTIPESVISIGDCAFRSCTSLTSITIPDGVTSVGNHAFDGCSSLTSIIIGNSVTSIAFSAFNQCTSLTSITIPNSVTSIGDQAFRKCTSLTSITIPDSVTSIGEDAFSWCENLTSITVPDSVTSIGADAFYSCTSLTSITIPDSVTTISEYMFRECTSLTSITIPDSVTTIGVYAFDGCSSLTRVIIPDSVTSIGVGVFYGCTSLTSVTIPDSVTSIKGIAFNGCEILTDVYYGGTEDQWIRIEIRGGNDKLTTANIHYEYKRMEIVTQPKTAKVKEGSAAKFTVKASGEDLKYQWQSSTDGKTWKNCSSSAATKSTFSFTSKTSHNGNYYRCKVTDGAGNVVYTDAVRLYVLGITTQPTTKIVKAGATIKFTVKATGTGLKYQWQSSADGKTWKNCSSSTATKATFSFTSKTSHNGNYYRCKVTDSTGNVVYTSTVRAYVLGVTTQPKTQTVKAGAAIKFTVKATGTDLKYQWQVSTNGKTWKNCSSTSAKKATFTFTSKTSHDGNYYRCKVTDSEGNVVYTSTVRAYVLGIEEQPVKKTVTKGKTAKFTVEATGRSLKYQWQVSTNGGKTFKNCSSTSAKKATFSFTTKTTHNGNYYRCRITDSAGNVIYTSKVKLTVK